MKFRFENLRGNDVRIAYAWREFKVNGTTQHALVQVAETLEKRSQLANEIIRGVIVPQFIVLPIAVVLVWFGLSRGLAPLAALQARIRAREPDDMSPIDPHAAPGGDLAGRRRRSTSCSSGCRATSRCSSGSSRTPRTR